MGFEKTGRVGLGDNAQPDEQEQPVSEPEAPDQDEDNGRADD